MASPAAADSTTVSQLRPDETPVIPDGYFDPPPQVVEPVGDSTAELAALRSRLSNIQALPLFLPDDQGELVSASTQLSATQLSEPTFAWIEDQLIERYGPNARGQNEAAITQWRVYQTNDRLRYVDVIIDTGLWTQFTYFDRYAFVQQFGSATMAKGYQLRVFHTEDVDNYIEALSLEENGRDPTIARPVFLRGGYFCSLLEVGDVSLPQLCEIYVVR
ncbi:hypothetical protein IQ256_20440 [cf. Phormidesmis sp. LEGE 11477]|nr:hypothetical protein [cf. Phormidesmis sp. LEGE 11477]